MAKILKILDENYLADVEENDSNDTPACDDDARSHFFLEIGLTEVKGNDFKDTPHNKKKSKIAQI